MKALKIVGWIFVPWIMIFVSWKKLDKPKRIAGAAWAAVVLIGGIINAVQLDPPQQPVAVSAKPTQNADKQSAAVVEQPKQPVAPTAKSMNEAELERFKGLAPLLPGFTFRESINVVEGNKVVIRYLPSFAEYKNQNPQSKVSEVEYLNTFKSGDQINKILMQEPIRLFRDFPAVNVVDINLPFEGKTYTINIDRETASKYIGLSFDDLQDKEKWKQFQTSYFTKESRENFVKKFAKIN